MSGSRCTRNSGPGKHLPGESRRIINELARYVSGTPRVLMGLGLFRVARCRHGRSAFCSCLAAKL